MILGRPTKAQALGSSQSSQRSFTIDSQVRVQMAGPSEADTVLRSICVGERPSKSSLSFKREDDVVVLDIKADDIGSLRATLNSVLREIKIANDAILAVDAEKTDAKRSKKK